MIQPSTNIRRGHSLASTSTNIIPKSSPKRPRANTTVSVQTSSSPPPPPLSLNHVVVGISASVEEEDVEDWSSDFVEHPMRSRMSGTTLADRISDSVDRTSLSTRILSQIPRLSSGQRSSLSILTQRRSLEPIDRRTSLKEERQVEAEEDWDVEFGFIEESAADPMDADRRRSENFNIFLRGFHDMMAGEELEEELEERHVVEEVLFQRQSSEYILIDKYRLLSLASSTPYAVRIERYPKPCMTYSQLEKNYPHEYPLFTDHKLEQWLEKSVEKKRESMKRWMESYRPRSLPTLPNHSEWIKQIYYYHYFGEEKRVKELFQVFFQVLVNNTMKSISEENMMQLLQVFQEAAYMDIAYLSFLSVLSTHYPCYQHVFALLELRFVCHHLLGLNNYQWQVCRHYEPISWTGPSSCRLVQEILQYYGALLVILLEQIDTPSVSTSTSFNLSTDPTCLVALVVCDIQTIYDNDRDNPITFMFENEDDDEDQEQDPIRSLLLSNPVSRRTLLEETLYPHLSLHTYPHIKAHCAFMLSRMYTCRIPESTSLKRAESLAFEAFRILEFCSNPFVLISTLGRMILETLGIVCIKTSKYRYGIICMEAASHIYSFFHQDQVYERMDRLLCRMTMQAHDLERAIIVHERVFMSLTSIQEYIYTSQVLTQLYIEKGLFTIAERHVTNAFEYLRSQTSGLPPSYVACFSNRTSESEVTSSRSNTVLSSSSSSLSGSFLSSRGISTDLDSWLTHDITLHLALRDVYRSTGRGYQGMKLLEYLLQYTIRLPRGKRTLLRMMLIEDAFELCMYNTCRWILSLMDQEASTQDVEMVLSIRCILARIRLFLSTHELEYAFAWLCLAHLKQDQDIRLQVELYLLDGELWHLHVQSLQQARMGHCYVKLTNIETILNCFSSSLYRLNGMEQEWFKTQLETFYHTWQHPEQSLFNGIQAYWTAYTRAQALDDGYHQLKALLGVIQIYLTPIECCVFCYGKQLEGWIETCLVQDQYGVDGRDNIDATLNETQRLVRRALMNAEAIGDPFLTLQTLVYSCQVWIWMYEFSIYHNPKTRLEGMALWEQAVEILTGVFLRRVAMEQESATFSMVPILNFSEHFIKNLETITLQLISIGVLLDSKESTMNELVSAHMGLSSISNQLETFRSQQVIDTTFPQYSFPMGNLNEGKGSVMKRKGHKKNQSMSSISELLTASSEFTRTRSFLFTPSTLRQTAPTPRTGLAYVQAQRVKVESPLTRGRSISAPHVWTSYSEDLVASSPQTNSIETPHGFYVFEQVHSEKLWWIFNTWNHLQSQYSRGKLDINGFRDQNIRTLRLLMDTFDPQHVAMLSKESTHALFGFDIIHRHPFALIQAHGCVLSIGYPSHSYKVFRARSWRMEIPSATWYLTQWKDEMEIEALVMYTLQLVGVKVLFKLIGLLLLENPLVIVGSSFAQVHVVTMCLIRLLSPFQWQHTFLPFLPIASWQWLYDAIQEEIPFCMGVTHDTWQRCLLQYGSLEQKRLIPTVINVVDLNQPQSFTLVKNGIPFPRKWRKQCLERIQKIVKQGRKGYEKHSSFVLPSSPTSLSSSQWSYTTQGLKATMKSIVRSDCVYDNLYTTAFLSTVEEWYQRLVSATIDREKKRAKEKLKGSKREMKIWFSSSHDFDSYVETFLDTSIYQTYQKERKTTSQDNIPRVWTDSASGCIRAIPTNNTGTNDAAFMSTYAMFSAIQENKVDFKNIMK